MAIELLSPAEISVAKGHAGKIYQDNVTGDVYKANPDGSGLTKIGAGVSGSTTFAGLSDASIADLPAINGPLGTALDGKPDLLAGATFGAGATAITRALHHNRPNTGNQAAAFSGTFAVAATSGAIAGDGFELLVEGSGKFTATGEIDAPAGTKLTATKGQLFTAVYDAVADKYHSTTPAGSKWNLVAQSGANVLAPNDTADNTLATISLPPLGPNAKVMIRDIYFGAGSSKNYKVKLNGTTLIDVPTNQNNYSRDITFQNQNSASSQFCIPSSVMSDGGPPAGGSGITASIDTSVATTLTLTVAKSVGADPLTLKSYQVVVIDPDA